MAAWFSGRAAVADLYYRENNVPALSKAISLAPDNVVYRALLAEHLEGLDQDPKPQLAEVTRLSPLDSQYWIRRAFRAEVEQDYPVAENFLREAARIDRKARPRWALMNFYFRRNRDTEFWYWVNQALQMSGADVTSIFRLSWDKSDDNSFIFSQIPDRPDLAAKYFYFLSTTGRLGVASSVALKVAERGPVESVPGLVEYCERYALEDTGKAMAVWNALCKRKLLPFEPLSPDSGQILTNPAFAQELSEGGFDWHARSNEGVLMNRDGRSGELRVEFVGSQPQDCLLMTETIPLSRGTDYEISWESGSQSTVAVPGLQWEVQGKAGLVGTGTVEGTLKAAKSALRFRAVDTSATLQLRYRRPVGSVRARGIVTIRDLKARIAQ